VFIFPLCVLLVFLTLAAQYESWSLPLAIILIVPMCLLSAITGVWLRHMDNNIFTQVGLVVLVGLASKNAIHIVEFASKDPWQTVVGVVERVKQDSLDSDPRIAFYLAHTQFPTRAMTVAFRGGTDPAAMVSAVRNALRNLDPDLPMYYVRTMEQRVDESLARRRFSMLLLGVFASVALALATIGIYGVMAYLVNQGIREIGIRMALGATQRNILSLVVWQGMALALSGVTLGLVAAFLLTRLIRSLLFGVQATDPFTFAGIALLLVMIALFASYIPAQRAARIDPLMSLRCD